MQRADPLGEVKKALGSIMLHVTWMFGRRRRAPDTVRGEEGEDVLREERVKERSPITNLGAGVGVRRIPVADFNALLVFELGARGTGARLRARKPCKQQLRKYRARCRF